MDVLGFAFAGQPLLTERTAAVLADQGVRLTRDQLVRIEAARRTALTERERVEFEPGVVDGLLAAFADSPFLGQGDVVEVVSEVVELFYAVRDDVPIEVPDDEVIEALTTSFDAFEGEVAALDASSIAQGLAVAELTAGGSPACDSGGGDPRAEYEIADDAGRVYRWFGDWEYDELAPGWDGERWGDDLD